MTDDIGPGWLDDLRERSWTNYCGRMAKREITSPASTKKSLSKSRHSTAKPIEPLLMWPIFVGGPRELVFPRQQCQSGSLPPVASRSGPVHALVH
jgi:hypothetical protein